MNGVSIENITHLDLLNEYVKARRQTEQLCKPLAVDDYVIHLPNKTVPVKWHLGHVTWYMEKQVLLPFKKDYQSFNSLFADLFDDHYGLDNPDSGSVAYGLFSRPTVDVIFEYRAHVDEAIEALLDDAPDEKWDELRDKLMSALLHEQQHQELMLEHIKQNFSVNPLLPGYNIYPLLLQGRNVAALEWIERCGNHSAKGGNVVPLMGGAIAEHYLANRLITNWEYLAFVEDDGYSRGELWSDAGRRAVATEGWRAPLYWRKEDNNWFEFTLNGMMPLELDAPVIHVSYYEAEAFARWAGKRLPTDRELAGKLHELPVKGNFVEQANFHPIPGHGQWYGDAWEWSRCTQESDTPSSGRVAPVVLRGGACVTSRSQMHPNRQRVNSPASRQVFSGIRLASNA